MVYYSPLRLAQLLKLRRKYYLESDHYLDRTRGVDEVDNMGEDEETERR